MHTERRVRGEVSKRACVDRRVQGIIRMDEITLEVHQHPLPFLSYGTATQLLRFTRSGRRAQPSIIEHDNLFSSTEIQSRIGLLVRHL